MSSAGRAAANACGPTQQREYRAAGIVRPSMNNAMGIVDESSAASVRHRCDMRAAMKRLSVVLVLAGAGLHATAAEFDCVIEPKQVIELRSPLEGLIDRMNVDRGDFVRKGQEVAVLDTSVEQIQAAIAKQRSQMEGAVIAGKSRVEFSSSKARRIEELHRDKFMSEQARDEAATEKALAEAELRDASDNRMLAKLEYQRQQEIIRLKTIRSPIAGVVTERILHPGEFAEAGVGRKPLMKLAEIDVLYAEVLLPVEAYGQVQRGQSVAILPEVPAGTRLRATVKVVDIVLDAASGTFGVRLEMQNKDRKIPAGIRCKASFPNIGADTNGGRRTPKPTVQTSPRGAVQPRPAR
ncbi:MAG: efflux RND transporter periplasmic adaptor subunit [Betaproteobacteria bacterium]|nr:efflux RND transporter periplasmic adaptor subunit [Betaproteobacteria bacterium]